MHEPITATALATHGGLAVFGGIVHALNAHRNGQSKGIMDFLALSVISTFAGVIFALSANYFFPHAMYLTHAAAGAGGFLGVEGLSTLAFFITQRMTGKGVKM